MRHPVVVRAQHGEVLGVVRPALPARRDVVGVDGHVPPADHAHRFVQAGGGQAGGGAVVRPPVVRVVRAREVDTRGRRRPPGPVPVVAHLRAEAGRPDAVGLHDERGAALRARDRGGSEAAEFRGLQERLRVEAVRAGPRAERVRSHLGGLPVGGGAAPSAGRRRPGALLPLGRAGPRAEDAPAVALDLAGVPLDGLPARLAGVRGHKLSSRRGLG